MLTLSHAHTDTHRGIFIFHTELSNTALNFSKVSSDTTVSHDEYQHPVALHDGENRFPYPGTYTIRGSFQKVTAVGIQHSPFHSGSVYEWKDTETQDITGLFFNGRVEYAVSPPPTVTDMTRLFYKAKNVPDIRAWDVSNVVTMHEMFAQTVQFDQSLNTWDFGNVRDMRKMFYKAQAYNNGKQPISFNTSNLERVGSMFHNAKIFNQSVNGLDTSNVVDMHSMFRGARSFNNGGEPLHIETSKVTNMNNMFHGAERFRQDVSSLQTGNVRSMQSMFHNAEWFTMHGKPLPWDVSQVRTMKLMFARAHDFDADLSSWDVSNVYHMEGMFSNARLFKNGGNPSLPWNTSNVTNMRNMFQGTKMNSAIGSWDVSSVTNMMGMFDTNRGFNQPIGSWNVSNVTDMRRMFNGAIAFDQDIGAWDVSNVRHMDEMFLLAWSFNNSGKMLHWDTSRLESLKMMFQGAECFNQDIGSWDVSNVTNFSSLFFRATSFNNGGAPLYWDTSNMISCDHMFHLATSFDQCISHFDFRSLLTSDHMLRDAKSFTNGGEPMHALQEAGIEIPQNAF